MLCPFCHQHMHKKPEQVALSTKKQKIFDFIMGGGPRGVKISSIKEKFFPKQSDISIRTTIHYLNRDIKPSKIKLKNGWAFLERY